MRISLLLLAPAALALGGCTSLERAVRISPFSAQQPSSDRVNLFPIAYWDGHHSAAVLWPLMDFDEDGFAVRPVVTKENSELSVAFPLSQLDLDRGTGWIGPFYRFEESKGLFPLAHFGEEIDWLGPAWRRQDGERSSRGLFPVAKFGGDLSYAGPVWWTDPEEGSDRERSFGLFPLFSSGRFNHVGPAYWSNDDEDDRLEELGLFPLYHRSRRDAFESDRYLLSLAGRHRDLESGHDRHWALPLWYRSQQGDAEDHVLAPFFYERVRGDERRVFTLLGNWRVDGEESGLNVYPLWWSWAGEDHATKMLLPLFLHHRERDRRTLLTPLGGRSWSEDGRTHFVNVLGPLYFRSRSGDETTTSFLWPLFERRTAEGRSSTSLRPFFGHESSPGRSEGWFAAGLGHYRTGAEDAAWRFWPLAAHSEGPEPDWLYEISLFRSRNSGDSRSTSLHPLFSHERSPGHRRLSLVALFEDVDSDDGDSTRLFPLFSVSDRSGDVDGLSHLNLFAHHEGPTRSEIQVGTSFLFNHRHRSTERETRKDTHLLTFFTRRSEHKEVPVVPNPRWLARVDRQEMQRVGFLFDWMKFETARYRRWQPDSDFEESDRQLAHQVALMTEDWEPRVRDPLLAEARAFLVERGIEVGDDESVRAELLALAQQELEEIGTRHTRIPLLFEIEREAESLEWDALLGLVQGRRDVDVTSFRLLYALYKSETRGERTTRDFFPFFTWDSAPEDTTFSFLWRVFRYQNEGGERSGHILFIPW